MSELIKIIDPDYKFVDERGMLYQLSESGWVQINVLITFKDAKRGLHYHSNTKEAFFIIDGKIDITVMRNKITENYKFNSGDFFIINPNVTHKLEFIEKTYMVAMYDHPVIDEHGIMDIHQVY